MEIRNARLGRVLWDHKAGEYEVTFRTKAIPRGLEEIEGDQTVALTPEKKRRSLNANALLWACIGDISKAVDAAPWDIYLKLLRDYGKFHYVVIQEVALEDFKRQWRETMVVGESEIGGKKAIQLLCFCGSHTYNSQEFSRLINGAISEMKNLNLEPPPSGDILRAINRLKLKDVRCGA